MRYLAKLSYRGAEFCGWQVQPDAPSVQQTLEQALSTLLRTPVSVTGAGRTELTLTPEYLKTLETGEHTLVIRYNDGTAETRFTIKANTSVTPAPATGDSGVLLFAFLCAASLFAAAALLPRKKEND